MKNKKLLHIFTLGFALFTMIFGAGNLLIPPLLGLQTGANFSTAIFAFVLTAVLLPFLVVLAIAISGNDFNDLGNRVNKKVTIVLGTIIMICIGPCIAIPRTASTTFETGLKPFFPEMKPYWGSIIFFVITFIFSYKPSKVVDLLGKFMTPILLFLLILLIVCGVINPTTTIIPDKMTMTDSFVKAFLEGYQTLDVLAAVAFSGLIITAAKKMGYTDIKSKTKIVITSGILTICCLLFFYGGLIFLGASSGITNNEIQRSELLIKISENVLGEYGLLAIALCMSFACLTTAIALTVAVGTFFSKMTRGKLSYLLLIILCTIISFILSIAGVDKIIKFAYPALAFVYPITITLVIYIVIFGKKIKNQLPYKLAMLATAVIAFLDVLKLLNLLDKSTLSYLNIIPFFSYDLGWIFPSCIAFLIGLLYSKINAKNKII